MIEAEVPLAGGTHGPVMRLGATVRREVQPSTATVHALLRHLERAGFAGAPRALGFDEQGREVLTFLPGEVGVRIDGAPPPPFARSDETLVHAGRLLRAYHDATISFVAPPDATWPRFVGAPRAGEVICHNDIGPYNTVFVDGVPVAFIDWDEAAPGPREWDVAYALYRFVPYVPDEICALIGWPAPPDRPRRLRLFCDAYRLADRSSIFAVMARRIDAIIATGDARDAAGWPGFGEFWREVMRKRLVRDFAFVHGQDAP